MALGDFCDNVRHNFIAPRVTVMRRSSMRTPRSIPFERATHWLTPRAVAGFNEADSIFFLTPSCRGCRNSYRLPADRLGRQADRPPLRALTKWHSTDTRHNVASLGFKNSPSGMQNLHFGCR